jgi:hypothetical protein
MNIFLIKKNKFKEFPKFWHIWVKINRFTVKKNQKNKTTSLLLLSSQTK